MTVAGAAAPNLDRILRPGDHVLVGSCAGEPTGLLSLLVQQRHQLPDIDVLLGLTLTPTITAEHLDALAVTVLGAYGENRSLVGRDAGNVLPVQLSRMPDLLRSRAIPVDVVFCQCSPAGPDGTHSLGVTADVLLDAVESARTVVAEVNDQMPYTYGDTSVPAERIDHRIFTSRPLPSLPPAPVGGVAQAIAGHVADLIPDRSVLQLGIGQVPDAIVAQLRGRRDLGVHSGLVTDSVLDLIECGAVTNAYKPVDTGVTVAGVLMGSRRLYDWAHRNEHLCMRSTRYTHDPGVVSRIPGFVSVNTAVEVDLSGQVNAETAGGRYLGAVGGHVDYVRAGAASAGGRSIVALPSTAASGSLSRIVPVLGDGAVTTLRTDVDVIATEYGAAHLAGCTLRERARRLAAIAHPRFREDLEAAAMATRQA